MAHQPGNNHHYLLFICISYNMIKRNVGDVTSQATRAVMASINGNSGGREKVTWLL